MRSTSHPALRAAVVVALTAAVGVYGCVGEFGGSAPEWDDDDPATQSTGERTSFFKHGPPPGPAPWKYFLTCYGGKSDRSAYNGTPACGGKRVNGQWWYATGAYTFGCRSKLELRANGKCVVVNVVDNGPAAWVESRAKRKCGATGYIIDTSPLVTKHLYGKACAGWTDCLAIQVRKVASNTPTGPCSGGSPGPTDPGRGCHSDVPFGWLYCSPSCPCKAGEGDCDKDSDCEPGLRCAHNVGAKYGAGKTVDVCEGRMSVPTPTPRPDRGVPSITPDAGVPAPPDAAAPPPPSPDAAAPPPPAPDAAAPPPSTSCAWNSGKTYRRCGDCGWQFCLKSGNWSTACEPAGSIFPCSSGRCRSDASCR